MLADYGCRPSKVVCLMFAICDLSFVEAEIFVGFDMPKMQLASVQGVMCLSLTCFQRATCCSHSGTWAQEHVGMNACCTRCLFLLHACCTRHACALYVLPVACVNPSRNTPAGYDRSKLWTWRARGCPPLEIIKVPEGEFPPMGW